MKSPDDDKNIINNDKIIIHKKNDTKNKNPFSIQLKLNVNINEIKKPYELYEKKITKINELSNNRIGIIFNDYLVIYSSYKFKEIYRIKPFHDFEKYKIEPPSEFNSGTWDNFLNVKSYRDSKLNNFLELKNKDLIILSEQKIFYYKLLKKNSSLYIIHQIINEFNQGANLIINTGMDGMNNYDEDRIIYEHYCLNSVCELMNGNLVSGNSFGLKLYNKINDNYNLISKQKMLSIDDIIEFDVNKLILIQSKKFSNGKLLLPFENPMMSFKYALSISIYNIKENKSTILIPETTNIRQYFFDKRKNFFVLYYNKIDIYDNKKIELIHSINHINIEFLSNYLNEYYIVRDLNCYKIEIYSFKDNKFIMICDFPFQKENIKGIIKLKNNNLIMYSEKQLEILNTI